MTKRKDKRMPWWGITLTALGAFTAGGIVGYGWALLQVGKGMTW